jgi:cytochrome c oxidase subunit 1
MLIQGMGGVHRRWYDGGAGSYLGTIGKMADWNHTISVAAWILGAFQLIFVYNFFASILWGRKVPNDNPWDATTLEWDTPTPPPHGNFIKPIHVYRPAYEYSVPGADKDFTPQSEPPAGHPPAPPAAGILPAPAH